MFFHIKYTTAYFNRIAAHPDMQKFNVNSANIGVFIFDCTTLESSLHIPVCRLQPGYEYEVFA